MWEDIRINKARKNTIAKNIIDYLDRNGKLKEYTIEQLKEKYLLIDWIAYQLCYDQPRQNNYSFIENQAHKKH